MTEKWITAQESGERIDALLARCMEGVTRSGAARLLEAGVVTLDGRPVRKNHRTEAGQTFQVLLPEPECTELVP